MTVWMMSFPSPPPIPNICWSAYIQHLGQGTWSKLEPPRCYQTWKNKSEAHIHKIYIPSITSWTTLLAKATSHLYSIQSVTPSNHKIDLFARHVNNFAPSFALIDRRPWKELNLRIWPFVGRFKATCYKHCPKLDARDIHQVNFTLNTICVSKIQKRMSIYVNIKKHDIILYHWRLLSSWSLLLLLLLVSSLLSLLFYRILQRDIGGLESQNTQEQKWQQLHVNTSQDAPGRTRPKENTKASPVCLHEGFCVSEPKRSHGKFWNQRTNLIKICSKLLRHSVFTFQEDSGNTSCSGSLYSKLWSCSLWTPNSSFQASKITRWADELSTFWDTNHLRAILPTSFSTSNTSDSWPHPNRRTWVTKACHQFFWWNDRWPRLEHGSQTEVAKPPKT